MLLSALLKMDPMPERAFGVTVDEPSFVPPQGLKEIGLLFPLEGEGIDEIDVAIAYSMAGVNTLLEIPAERADVDALYTLSTAANIGVSLSLLPPKDAAGLEAWIERVDAFTKVYLSSGSYAKELLPVTAYLQYMFAKVVSDMTGFEPKDPYIVEHFANAMAVADSDRMKARVRETVHAHFGGRAGFEEFVHAMAVSIYKKVDSNMQDVVKLAQERAQATSEQGKGDGA